MTATTLARRIAAPLVALGLIGACHPAFAQPSERGFVQGLAGPTFGTETAGLFGVEVGLNAGPYLQITGEVGSMRNILPKWVQEEANEAADLLELGVLVFLGRNVSVGVNAKAPTFYGMGGLRLLPPVGRVRPYVSISGGLANVSPEVRLSVDGEDVTDAALRDGLLDRIDSATRFMMSVGGGVSIPAGGPFVVDAGYRYVRIFTNQAISLNRVHGGVGVRF